MADFLAAHPIPDDSPLKCEFPDEQSLSVEGKESGWVMFFDGSSAIQPSKRPEMPRIRAGVGLVFITPQGGILRHSIALTEPCTNNEAEYEALIAGLELAIEMDIKEMKVCGDSQLILNQVEGIFEVKKPELVKYHERAQELMAKFTKITLEKVSRAYNGMADALARVATQLSKPDDEEIQIMIRNRRSLAPYLMEIEREANAHLYVDLEEWEEDQMRDPDEVMEVEANNKEDWRKPFVDYFQHQVFPGGKMEREQLKRRVLCYVYVNDTLYRRSYDQLWLRCVSQEEAQKIVREVHSGFCGAHQSGPKMRLHIKRMGYYWPTMIADCENYAKRCHMCQVNGDFIHQHPNPLHPTVASWPFNKWGNGCDRTNRPAKLEGT
ncbi:hypothetical protein LUZ61_018083 [Rhynchospora tenuis]|uniref:RNase H type-1 domain-containing protein n=1 Tax=Rhynchospora tenuis TaxID=198213 RepID=A0AAD5Z8V2_9POAL|nr:hypothetical protein LUZ61_018083 [Rhynchospora tenuis]